jgi:hypothetical protein
MDAEIDATIMSGHSIESFVLSVFLDDLHRMTYDYGLHYLAFGTIAVGIEFLRACEDAFPFEEKGKSQARFKLGINGYMARVDPRYTTYNDRFYLYRHLRCGMAHVLRPLGTVGFSSRSAAHKAGQKHLDLVLVRGHEILLLTAEDFYDHFEQACGHLLDDLLTKTDPKFQSVYLRVSELPAAHDASTAAPSLSGA